MSCAFLLLLLCAGEVRVERHAVEPARLAAWRAAPEERPALRGFRAPILQDAGEPLRLTLPDPAADARAAQAARTVAARLARDGLRATLVAAVQDLGPERVAAPGGVALLTAAGFPLDLLACFGEAGAEPLAQRVARDLRAGRAAEDVQSELAALPFRFAPTVPGWRVASESGEEAAGAVRLQVSSAVDYAQPGEGGAMDVLRHVARSLPDAQLLVSVEEKHAAGIEAEARRLAAERGAPITLIVEPLPVAQWAQDVAKAGTVERGGKRAAVWLAPRYASRGEDGSTFVPGENLLLDGLARAGRAVARSPLLFQGGDLLPVRDPRDGTRWLLVGEAEVARNRALGLARDEVLAALRAEFGVERCVVLPAVSFHVDLEVCVRAGEQGLVACVLDTSRAARIVVRCGLDALERARLLAPDLARAAREDLDADRHQEFFARLGPLLESGQHGGGRFVESFARAFAAGPQDSGVGNLQRFLTALDLWTAELIGAASAADLGIDAASWAYLDSLRRREADRMRVAQALAGLGWTVVPVPGTSDGTRSLNPLNGVHLRGKYLQPAYGGIFAPLDEAARAVLAPALGNAVEVVPVPCGETQRRAGGVHCAVGVEPHLDV
jgi:hypothetical protein